MSLCGARVATAEQVAATTAEPKETNTRRRDVSYSISISALFKWVYIFLI